MSDLQERCDLWAEACYAKELTCSDPIKDISAASIRGIACPQMLMLRDGTLQPEEKLQKESCCKAMTELGKCETGLDCPGFWGETIGAALTPQMKASCPSYLDTCEDCSWSQEEDEEKEEEGNE